MQPSLLLSFGGCVVGNISRPPQGRVLCAAITREKMRQVSAKIKALEYYPSIKCGRTQRENEAGLSYNRSFHDVIHILGVARTREKMRQVSAKIILLQSFPNIKCGRNQREIEACLS